MAALTYPTYLAHIRSESSRFRDVLAGCDPAARVPSAPEWTAADLLGHLGAVQHWWCHCIVNRPAAPDGYDEPQLPTAYADLLAFYDEWHVKLVDALAAADPAEPAWSWSQNPADHTVAFTYRRQAHEALIHRLDAELAAGAVTPLDPELAFDGVEEVLSVMYGGMPPWGSFDPLPHYVEFRATDLGRSVWTQLGVFSGTSPGGEEYAGEKDIHVVAEPAVPADAVVSGTAADLDAWLWHRRDDAAVTVTGDRGVYGHVRELLDHPIN